MEILLTLLISAIYQFAFFKIIKSFKIKNIYYVISLIISWLVFFSLFDVLIVSIPLLLVIQILILLSFVDYVHYEIDGNSYYFLIVPIIVLILLNGTFLSGLKSFIFMFFALYFMDVIGEKVFNYKLKKNDSIDDGYQVEEVDEYGGIGGGDIKILLILSACFDLMSSFSFLFYTGMFTAMLYVILCMKNRKFSNIMIPMIISITVAFISSYHYIINNL